MKITGNYFNPQVNKKNIQKQNAVEKSNFKSHLKSVDSITISASKEQIIDAQFVSSLKRQISDEVKSNTSSEDISNLSEQISKGTYEIGANDIAKKILLMNNES